MIKHTIIVSALISSLLLGGCLTSNQPSPNLYVLHPEMRAKDERASVPVSAIVERPSIVSGLNTDRIALLKNNRRELDYFSSARWNGQLDRILQDFIIESFENSFDIIEVDSSGVHQNAEYAVVTKIRDFQAEYAGEPTSAPMLRVTIVTSILKLPEKKPVARFIKSESAQANRNSITAVTKGLEGLLTNVTNDILRELQSGIMQE